MRPLLLGLALGAVGAFLLDPQHGRRRRALVRDKAAAGREFADAAATDLRRRARGIAAGVQGLRGAPVSDEVLAERVRAKLGRHASRPGAIQVAAHAGCITLTGDILAAEVARVFDAVRALRGVQHVDNRMNAYPSAAGVSSLQDDAEPGRVGRDLFQVNWTPGIRLIAGGTGALLLLYALARGGLSGIGALGIGALLVGRASTSQPLGALTRSRTAQIR